ncbi:MAG TPA: hypothetical protein VK148_13675 [Xanthobacteraceae bacterium]|jgi:hypothetical protein|nr:hypothetical protein [Xanthobacteraceae bacterium]
MAVELDGFSLLNSIGAHAHVFSEIKNDVLKAARTLVVKQLKTKSAGMKSLRDVRESLGHDSFALIVDGMKDAEVKSLLGKLDKHQPELKGSNPQWRVAQLRALADGSIEPAAEDAAKTKSGKKSKATVPERLTSRAMAAVRKDRR